MVELKGPFFSPAADAIAEEEIESARHRTSEQAEARVRAMLGTVLRNPTGYYESRITTDLAQGDTDLVTDNNVVYGPWLEGVSSRNATTRFKGYATFRTVAQTMQGRGNAAAQEAAERIVRRIG